VAYVGAAPIETAVTVTPGGAGLGGVGGDGDAAIGGASGLACSRLDLADPASCAP
jgi:hypothetical protein